MATGIGEAIIFLRRSTLSANIHLGVAILGRFIPFVGDVPGQRSDQKEEGVRGVERGPHVRVQPLQRGVAR